MRSKTRSFAALTAELRESFDSLSNRKVILFGGKGGVGKTTLSSLAALALSENRDVTLFSTDPASNLGDLFGSDSQGRLRIESVDAGALYQQFLNENLAAFLELGDRGTYLDRDELGRLFELSLPGIDELMSWLRIGDLSREREDLLLVDTAPTGHTLRMLGSSGHFQHFEEALDSMQQKHAEMVAQLTRRSVRDAMDQFLDRLADRFEQTRRVLKNAAFVPVFLAEPLVVEQTRRLIDEVREMGTDVPFAVLNRATHDCDCADCEAALTAQSQAEVGAEIVVAPRACVQLDSPERLRAYLAGKDARAGASSASELRRRELQIGDEVKLIFFAGKGGVGKTSSATSVALQAAARSPDKNFTIISVDPAHSLRDLFQNALPPDNLAVEFINTREKWNRLREKLGEEISRAVDALTPRGMSMAHDENIMRRLIDIAPPGADELFAIERLSHLSENEEQHQIFVDTAPTGHFLRLLELPNTAGEWVREFMRLLLKYKEVISAGTLGEQLVRASRALKSFEATLRSGRCAAVIVTRPDRIVIEETLRLSDAIEGRGMRIAGVIANALTPDTDCSCDRSQRADERTILDRLDRPVIPVERRSPPPGSLDDLRSLIPLA